jgi:hypothetical protein
VQLHQLAHQMRHKGMGTLVVGEEPLLLVGDHAALLETCRDALHRAFEVGLPDVLQLLAAREDRRLVRDVREVGARESGRLLRDQPEIQIGRERLLARVHAQDLLAPREIGRRDQHLPVEAARAQQRRVEILQAVRRAHHDDLVAEAVQLDEQLVQRLIVLAVEAVAAARHPDSVQLVDEDHRRRMLARLLEQLADPGRAEPGEHLDERGRTRRVEVRA